MGAVALPGLAPEDTPQPEDFKVGVNVLNCYIAGATLSRLPEQLESARKCSAMITAMSALIEASIPQGPEAAPAAPPSEETPEADSPPSAAPAG